MEDNRQQLEWIASEGRNMETMVRDLAAVNSGSRNTAGLAQVLALIQTMAAPLKGDMRALPLAPRQIVNDTGELVEEPLGQALSIRKRPDAPLQIFFGIHMDTVFDADHPFQEVEQSTPGILRGPGVTDAKGGIVILLKTLEALERCRHAARIGWEVLINPDEEIGSPGSASLYPLIAARNQFGLLYEPAAPDGSLVGARKGSGNFTCVIRGRAAHAGRNPDEGRSAVTRLAQWILDLDELQQPERGWTVNVARITGGGPLNQVPDLAIAHCNIRFEHPGDQDELESYLRQFIKKIESREGYSATLHGGFHCPPKIISAGMQHLMRHLASAATDLGMNLKFSASGGVCDGNRLAACGLPNLDTLGARGGAIHTAREYLDLDSLVERTRLSVLFLMKLIKGEWTWPS